MTILKRPSYSLDISPCNFHVSGLLQKALKGCTFTMEDNVQEVVVQ
jgi:hypothetical protein